MEFSLAHLMKRTLAGFLSCMQSDLAHLSGLWTRPWGLIAGADPGAGQGANREAIRSSARQAV